MPSQEMVFIVSRLTRYILKRTVKTNFKNYLTFKNWFDKLLRRVKKTAKNSTLIIEYRLALNRIE